MSSTMAILKIITPAIEAGFFALTAYYSYKKISAEKNDEDR